MSPGQTPLIFREDVKFLGGSTLFLQKQAKKGVVDFEEGKVSKVIGHAFKRQGFFIEGFTPDPAVPAGNLFLTSPLRVNLPDPHGIPVTCGAG